MAIPQVPLRSVVLSLLAALLTGVTAYDYLVGLPDRRGGTGASAPAEAPAPGTSAAGTAAPPQPTDRPAVAASPAVDPRQRIADLEYLRDNATLVRQRYHTIAVPYAEAVAGFATLLAAGQAPRDKAGEAIRSLVPAAVQIKDLLIADATTGKDGALLVNATLSLSSADSQAMLAALMALGDAGNGMVWKELALGIDNERHQVSAKGQLNLLMARQAE